MPPNKDEWDVYREPREPTPTPTPTTRPTPTPPPPSPPGGSSGRWGIGRVAGVLYRTYKQGVVLVAGPIQGHAAKVLFRHGEGCFDGDKSQCGWFWVDLTLAGLTAVSAASGAGALRAAEVSGAEVAAVAGTEGAAEAGVVARSANATRLAAQLTEQEARAVFTSSGALQPEVIAGSTEIINGTQLSNQTLVKALTADGSNIADWGKYATQPFRSPSGPFQMHFYHNSSNGRVFYELDYKAVFTGGG
jgi:hypothetical protein